MKRELGFARCGLACCLCSENSVCKGCKVDGFVDLSWCKDAEWCENRNCCIEKNIEACYACDNSECQKGLFKDKIKPRAFCEFIRRYSKEELLDCLEANEKNGIVYHREGIFGDYDDFDNIEELIYFIKNGKRASKEISAGAIIYAIIDEEIKYLLIKDFHQNWGFPKGHLENNETEIDAAIREIKEEVGIDIKLDVNFKEELNYIMPNNKAKKSIYFTGFYQNQEIHPQLEEVIEASLFSYDEALKIITFDNMKQLLIKANKYIKQVK
ncbi:MAG: NUDIX domain-containing protein [Erysipelotrichaceae bacterium]|nr:NUDIX domain-containing protein [Erysipelotrichaceae bacterium]